MNQIHSNRRTPAAATVLVCLLAALLLTACGGSSKGSTSSATSASASGAPNAPGGGKPGGPGAARFEALRECLQKNGIALPGRTAGKRQAPGTGGGFRGGAGPQLPKGVTQAQFQAALKKCGGTSFLRRGRFGAGAAQGYAKFAACMAKNGVKLPAPNTSGKGPIFNTKGVDTTSAAFKAADAKCARELGRGRSGAPQGGQPTGPPPAQ